MNKELRELSEAIARLADYRTAARQAGLETQLLRTAIAAATFHRKCMLFHRPLLSDRAKAAAGVEEAFDRLKGTVAALHAAAFRVQMTLLQVGVMMAIAEKAIASVVIEGAATLAAPRSLAIAAE